MKTQHRGIWIIAGGVIILGYIALVSLGKMNNRPPEDSIVVRETIPPTPTPIRTLSAVAVQTAFAQIVKNHASLSSDLAGTNLEDPSLTPPVLTLPLGFAQ